MAYQYDQVLGQEPRGKAIDVVQGPELNLDRLSCVLLAVPLSRLVSRNG
jgi:hypothetical protein